MIHSLISVTESLGGKHLVMQLLTREDLNVRYEALICVQKLMVQNWYSNNYLFCIICVFNLDSIFREYLGKQLEKETAKNNEISAKS